ncbi:hypothetical protein OESDEN_21887, partial [Oesophagostomum dentatum]
MLQDIINKRKYVENQEPGPSKESKLPRSLYVIENSMDRLIDELVYLEIKTEKFRRCAFNPHPESIPALEELLSSSCMLSLVDRIGPMPNWPLPDRYPTPEELEKCKAGEFPFINLEPERFVYSLKYIRS